jgi:hypothetical protein
MHVAVAVVVPLLLPTEEGKGCTHFLQGLGL